MYKRGIVSNFILLGIGLAVIVGIFAINAIIGVNAPEGPVAENTNTQATTLNDLESPGQKIDDISGDAVLIYSEEVSEESSSGRVWPTLNIWKKVGNTSSELLTTIGRVGEYPTEFAVSPDKKYLAINLESKLVILNIETKELKTLFVPKSTVGGKIAFSPDSTKLALADGNLYVHSNYSALYSIDVASGVATLLNQRDEVEYDGVDAWRPDNKFLLDLKVPKGGAADSGKVFDLSTKELTRLAITGPMSADGLLLAQQTNSSKSEVCHYSDDSWWVKDGDFRAIFPSGYAIVDPVTNIKKGAIDAPGKIIQLIAFHKNNDEILYRVINMPQKIDECTDYMNSSYPRYRAPFQYYIKDLKSEKVSFVEDYKSVLANWHANTINAITRYQEAEGSGARVLHIEIDGNSVVAASSYGKPISIIAQYYK